MSTLMHPGTSRFPRIRFSIVAAVVFTYCTADASEPAPSKQRTASVFAGGGTNVTGPAIQCRLADPFAVDFDAHGNAYICEMTNNRVVKVDARGILSVFAGTTKKGSSGDGGPATDAQLNGPHHLIVDRNGDLLIADSWNWRIRRVDARTGTITTFAGAGTRGFSGDGGPAEQAQFSGIIRCPWTQRRKTCIWRTWKIDAFGRLI